MSVTWNAQNAAHLLRRAGFGASPAQVEQAAAAGLEVTIASLFEPDPAPDDLPQKLKGLSELQGWWLRRMVETTSPLIEKLTLFWHNHFATGYGKVGSVPKMHAQNRTLRQLGVGSFRDLVLALTRDPAMLLWLDNHLNVKNSPNENFARELMELFTCGVLDRHGAPNYTEKDVHSAARAFTGWSLQDGAFKFKSNQHDYGNKKFKGQNGPLDGTDVIDLLVVDAATARRIPQLLFSWFAFPIDLDHPVLDGLSAIYLAHDTAIRPVLEAIFRDPLFYGQEARHAVVKGPAEFVVGALRSLGVQLSGKSKNLRLLAKRVRLMGQSLFDPPSVFGWEGHLTWVEPSGMLERARVAAWIAQHRKKKPGKLIPFWYDPAKLLHGLESPVEPEAPGTGPPEVDPDVVVAHVAARLGPLDLPPAAAAALGHYLRTNSKGKVKPLVLDKKTIDLKVRGLIALCLMCPAYQSA